ncbi:hypothetical protein DPEC_G00069050 [Dallia pectoralis]|uniref:Uncharacterized protein n=1 Tax=Dallia pectoralis TaxID=75939 RepID=A0ACC2H307_DALPE|nr:hypothetical protein DPEC_G00069050 [Dallia pectoralis]
MGDSPEDVSRDGIYVFDQGHVGFRLSRAPDVSDAPNVRTAGSSPDSQMRHTCPSRERWNCLHCGIAFRRDFANSVVRAGPEHSYDALVQFGNAPITNLQWKRDTLEKHIAERATHATVNGDRLLTEYMEKRQTRHRAQSKQQQPRKPTCTIKWKRPVCMQKKIERSGALPKRTRLQPQQQ